MLPPARGAALAMVLSLVVPLAPTWAFAQSGGTFDLTWNTFGGGGGRSTGSTFALTGTVGQTDAATVTGGTFTLRGGFWQPQCLPPTAVVGGIGSRYIRIEPNAGSTNPVAFRVACGAVTEWVQLVQTDYDDGGGVFVNVGTGAADCASADFLTPDQWTSSGANALYVTGLAVAPNSKPTVTAVCIDCAGTEAAPATPADPTWVFCDSSGDGQVTFVADLFKQFNNTAAISGPGFTGPDPGIEVDTQGDWPTVPDQQVTVFADIFGSFSATVAGGGATWTGETCP